MRFRNRALPIITDEDAWELIEEAAPSLEPMPPSIEGAATLWGLFNCERYSEANPFPRFEPAYAPGGYFYEHSPDVQARWAEYDRASACSYSNWQILFNTACELGYTGDPYALDDDKTALPFVVAYIKRRAIGAGATMPEQVARAYNSGSINGHAVPGYVDKFMASYNELA